MKTNNKLIWPMALSLAAGVLLLFTAEFVGLFHGIDSFFYDLNFRLRGAQTRSSDILIAAVDEKTLAKFGKWPIKRSYYAKLLAKTSSARAVGFDIIWSEPSDDDNILASAIEQHGRVVLPAYLDSEINPVIPLDLFKPLYTGHVHVDQDIDGKVRQVYHTLYFKGRAYNSFSSAVYEAATGKTLPHAVVPAKDITAGSGMIYQFDPKMINYFGPLGSFQKVSLYELVDGSYPPSFFRNKVVLVGLTAEVMQSRFLTPFTDKRGGMSSIELHANILNNLLLNNSIMPLSEPLRLAVALIFMVMMLGIFMRLNEMRSTIALFFALAAILYISYAFFNSANMYIKTALFYAAAFAMFGISYLLKLNHAAAMLDREYLDIASHLRFGNRYLPDVKESGLIGFLSAGGINTKVKMADSLARQLLFEKTLTDAVISNSMSSILLFESAGALVMANDKVQTVKSVIDLDTSSLDNFISSIAPYIMGNSSSLKAIKTLSRHGETVNFTLNFPGDLYLQVDAVMISFENDKYLLFMMTDVSEIKRLEMLKNEMVSLISHELRTPLTAIQGYSNILEMSVDQTSRKYLDIINREANRMNRLISTYLDLSRLESGERLINRTRIDLPRLIDDIADIFKPAIDQKHISVKTELPDKLPEVMLDYDLLRQGLLNLVENAVKYSPADSSIHVKVNCTEGLLRINVEDQGCGMDNITARKIFDKFYRAQTHDASSEIAGHGLGLTFVKYATELQGGRISVNSTPGKGSVFTLTFPVAC